MKSHKKIYLISLIALILCISIIVGTTFAWYTDDVTLKDNKVQAGTLDVDLLMDEMSNGTYSGTYKSIAQKVDPVFNYEKWEPGYSDAKKFQIVNKGDLALKYSFEFVVNSSYTGLENQAREENGATDTDLYYVLQEFGANQKLENALQVYVSGTNVGTLAQCLDNKNLILNGHSEYLLPNSTTDLGEVLVILPTDTDNRYENASILFDVRLYATQYTYEYDGFGSNQYDAMAEYPAVASFNPVSAHTTENQIIETSGAIKSALVKANAVNSIFDDMRDTNASANSLKLELNVNELGTKTEDDVTYFDFSADMNATMVSTKNNVTTVTNMAVTSFTDYVFFDINVGKDKIFVKTTHKGQDMQALASKTDIPTDTDGGYYYDFETGLLTIVTKNLSPFQASYKQGITFTVNGMKFVVEQGKTWAEICANDSMFVDNGSSITYQGIDVRLGEDIVDPSDTIVSGGTYTTQIMFQVHGSSSENYYYYPLGSKISDFLATHPEFTVTDNNTVRHVATNLLLTDYNKQTVYSTDPIYNFYEYGLYGNMTVSGTNYEIEYQTWDDFASDHDYFNAEVYTTHRVTYYTGGTYYIVTLDGVAVLSTDYVLEKNYDLSYEITIGGVKKLVKAGTTWNQYALSNTDILVSGTNLYYVSGTDKYPIAKSNGDPIVGTDVITANSVYDILSSFTVISGTDNLKYTYVLGNTFASHAASSSMFKTKANSDQVFVDITPERVLRQQNEYKYPLKSEVIKPNGVYVSLYAFNIDNFTCGFSITGLTWEQYEQGGYDTYNDFVIDSNDNVIYQGLPLLDNDGNNVKKTDTMIVNGQYHYANAFRIDQVPYAFISGNTWKSWSTGTDTKGSTITWDGCAIKINGLYVIDKDHNYQTNATSIVSNTNYYTTTVSKDEYYIASNPNGIGVNFQFHIQGMFMNNNYYQDDVYSSIINYGDTFEDYINKVNAGSIPVSLTPICFYSDTDGYIKFGGLSSGYFKTLLGTSPWEGAPNSSIVEIYPDAFLAEVTDIGGGYTSNKWVKKDTVIKNNCNYYVIIGSQNPTSDPNCNLDYGWLNNQ